MYQLNEGEKIKDIKGYEGSYAVTSEGRVYSYRRNIWLTQFDTGHGYMVVRLCNKGIEKDKKVHRLVAETFIRNKHGKPQVNHKNGIRNDNRATNLEWVTARENIQHACDLGLNSHFKLSLKDRIAICKMYYLCNLTKSYIALLYGITPAGVAYVIEQYSDMMMKEIEPVGHC